MASRPSTAIGIDLGTTYSCVSVMERYKPVIIADERGQRVVASYVAFTEEERLVGNDAKDQVGRNPTNTVYEIKRLIGHYFKDKNVQTDIQNWPFVVENVAGKPKIKVTYKDNVQSMFPEAVSGIILEKMKHISEVYLGTSVKDAVITVPAYFSDGQRQATRDAGKIAGLNVLRIIPEPTAAAIAYGLDKKYTEEKNILVYDLGGGTFDVSVLGVDGGIFEVKATSGNMHLGGQDFDLQLVKYMLKEFEKEEEVRLTGPEKRRATARLRVACETAKHALSSQDEFNVVLDSLFNGKDFKKQVTRTQFEELNRKLFNSTLEQVIDALKQSKLRIDQIDEVILVGGSTRIPKIRQIVQGFFNGKALNLSINPDEAVAQGAGIIAAKMSGRSFEELDEMLLLDVMPLSLGIQVQGGVMSPLTKRNRTIPTIETTRYETINDYQEYMDIIVLEGERALAKDNNLLGEFTLENLPVRPRGEVKVDVTFDIDADGILTVTAKEVSTEHTESIIIKQNKGRLTKEEIEDIIKDAEKFKAEDNLRRACIAARNKLDWVIYRMKSALNDAKMSSHIAQAKKKKMIARCNNAFAWIQDNKTAPKEEYQRVQRELKQFYEATIGIWEVQDEIPDPANSKRLVVQIPRSCPCKNAHLEID